MRTYLPETLMSAESLQHARTLISEMSDEELERQAASLHDQLQTIPTTQLQLSQRHEQLQRDIKNTALLQPLSVGMGDDLHKLEETAKAVAADRAQARVDLERSEVLLKIVKDTQTWRQQNTVQRALAHYSNDIKADLEQTTAEVTAGLAKLLALTCIANPGIRPEYIHLEGFIGAACGDVRKAAQGQVASIKAGYIDKWTNHGKREADIALKANTNALAGISKKKLIDQAIRAGTPPSELTAMLEDNANG